MITFIFLLTTNFFFPPLLINWRRRRRRCRWEMGAVALSPYMRVLLSPARGIKGIYRHMRATYLDVYFLLLLFFVWAKDGHKGTASAVHESEKKKERKWLVKGDCVLSPSLSLSLSLSQRGMRIFYGDWNDGDDDEDEDETRLPSLLIRRLPIVTFIDGFNTVSHLPLGELRYSRLRLCGHPHRLPDSCAVSVVSFRSQTLMGS